MIRSELLNVIEGTWPSVLICVIILVTLRIMYLVKNKEKIIVYRELFALSFIIYILCLFYVVTGQDNLAPNSNLIPFKEIMRYSFGSRLFIKNIIGNIIMFLPYGFFIAYYLKLEKVRIAVFLSLIVSSSIEVTQLLIGRIFDIDDIILNIVGGTMGAYIFVLFNLIRNKLPSFLKKEWFYNIIVLIIFLIFILYIMEYIEFGA